MPEPSLIGDRDIIYLAANDYDTGESKTSTDHIAEQFAKHNRVLFVESIGMRAPRVTGRDVRRVLAKLKSFFRKPRKIHDHLWVYTPIGIPLHRFGLVRWMNQLLLRFSIRLVARSLGFRDSILVVFLPQMGSVVGHLGESCSVYYCIDEYSAFPDVEPESVRKMEQALLHSVDVCFASARNLVEDKVQYNPNTFLSRHGVAFDHFAQAQDEAYPVAEDIAGIPHPVVGFFGYIERKWMDLDLIRYLAGARPEWNIVLVGKSIMDLSSLERVRNIHLVGQRHFSEIPHYGKAFDVCIIPFLVNEMTLHANPIKLWEYLAMGKPVVSTNLPEVAGVAQPGVVEIGRDHEDFVRRVEECFSAVGPEYVARRQALARERGTWEARMEAIGQRITEAEQRKGLK